MLSDTTCSNCDQELNITERQPRLLPCGHTVCSVCVDQIIQAGNPAECPDCKMPCSECKSFPLNRSLFEFIKRFTQPQPEKQKDRIVNESQAKVKKAELLKWKKEYDEHKQEMVRILEEEKELMRKIVKDKFEMVQEILKQKLEEELVQIYSFINDQITELHHIQEQEEIFRRNLDKQINALDSSEPNPEFLEALETRVPKYKTREEFQTVAHLLRSEKKRLSKKYNNLDNFESLLDHLLENKLNNNKIDQINSEPRSRSMETEEEVSDVQEVNYKFKAREGNDCLEIIIDNDNDNDDNPESLRILNDISKLKKMTELSIEFKTTEDLDEKLKQLSVLWSHLEDVSVVKIIISHQGFSDDNLDFVCSESFLINDEIESLDIDFNVECDITDSGLKTMLTMISKITKLKGLILGLEPTKMTDETLIRLSEDTLPRLVNLEILQLYIDDTEVTSDGIDLFFRNFTVDSEKMKTFALGLDHTEVNDENLITFTEEIFLKMSSLKTFNLSLNGTKITDEGINPLFRATEINMSNLEALILDLGETSISDKSILILSEQLEQAMDIKQFELHLDGLKVTNKSIIKLFDSLKQVSTNMTDFKLNLNQTEIQTKSIKLFAKKNIPLMKKLINFDLNLSDVKIKPKTLNRLSSNIKKNLTRLTTLSLNMSNNSHMSDEWLSKFAEEALPALKFLKNLELKLLNCQISGISLQIFSNKITEKIENITLDLGQTDVTTDDMFQLVEKLFTLPKLENLKLLLKGIDINDEDIESMYENGNKSVKNLTLDFS